MRAAGRGAPRARRAWPVGAFERRRAGAGGPEAQAGGGRSDGGGRRFRGRAPARAPRPSPTRAGRATGASGEGRSLRLNFGSSRGGHVCYETGKTQDRPILNDLYGLDARRKSERASSRPLVPGPECRIGTDCTHSSRSDRTAGGWGGAARVTPTRARGSRAPSTTSCYGGRRGQEIDL